MCRYAMMKYKEHYACFECQKTFKRKLLSDVKEGISMHETENPAKCPECGDWMASMGKDFRSPKNRIRKLGSILKVYIPWESPFILVDVMAQGKFQ